MKPTTQCGLARDYRKLVLTGAYPLIIVLTFFVFFRARWAFEGGGYDESCLRALAGVMSFLFWGISLYCIFGIWSEYRGKQVQFAKSNWWPVIFLFSVPVLQYAVRENLLSHSAEWLVCVFTVWMIVKRQFWIAAAGVILAASIRLHDAPIALMLLGGMWDSRGAKRLPKSVIVASVVVIAASVFFVARIGLVAGYHGILLSHLFAKMDVESWGRVFFTRHNGLVWYLPHWLMVFGSGLLFWRRLSWTSRAALVWMGGVLVIHVAHAAWWGGQSQQIRYLIGCSAGALVVALELMGQMGLNHRRLTHLAMGMGAAVLLLVNWIGADSNSGIFLPGVAFYGKRLAVLLTTLFSFALLGTLSAIRFGRGYLAIKFARAAQSVYRRIGDASAKIEAGFRHPIDWRKLNQLRELKAREGGTFPKVGILIVSYNASQLLVETLKRIPPAALEVIEEIFVFDDFSTDDTFALAQRMEGAPEWAKKLRAYRNDKNVGYGGNQKIGFEYARKKGMDYVVLLHGDGQYAPEFLPDLIFEAVERKKEVVFGSRMMDRWLALRGGMPFYKWVGNAVPTHFENLLLGLNLTEFHSGYRLYSTKVLERIPYLANADGFPFDTEIIIQCRALGVVPHEVSIPTYYGKEICRVEGMKYAISICLAVVRYRMHQLRIVFDPKFNVNPGLRYQLKTSPYSSHGRILERVHSGSSVLDVGCGRGLLAEKLSEKQCRVVGVDVQPRAIVWNGLEEYHQADLERLGEWKSSRTFDFVLLADVIEHVRNPEELLAETRKALKPGGRLVVSTGNVAIWFYRLSLLMGRFNYGARGILDETHVHLYTIDTFEHLIACNGYRVIKKTYTNLPFELLFRSTGKSLLVKAVDHVYQGLVLVWPRLFAYQTVIEAEKIDVVELTATATQRAA